MLSSLQASYESLTIPKNNINRNTGDSVYKLDRWVLGIYSMHYWYVGANKERNRMSLHYQSRT